MTADDGQGNEPARKDQKCLPPESDEKKAAPSFIKEFKSLVAKNIRGNMQLVSRVNELVKNAGKSMGHDRKKNDGKQSALLIRLLDFNLASYEILSSCTLDMLNGLVSAAEHLSVRQGCRDGKGSVPQGVRRNPGRRQTGRASEGSLYCREPIQRSFGHFLRSRRVNHLRCSLSSFVAHRLRTRHSHTRSPGKKPLSSPSLTFLKRS